MNKAQQKAARRKDAIDALTGSGEHKPYGALVKPGSDVYTQVTHVSSSGMSRSIRLFVLSTRSNGNGRKRIPCIVDITRRAAVALDYKIDEKNGGLKMGGCGMDMGFAAVYNLGSVLWPKGTRRPHGIRNGQPDKSGGYALNQRWL